MRPCPDCEGYGRAIETRIIDGRPYEYAVACSCPAGRQWEGRIIPGADSFDGSDKTWDRRGRSGGGRRVQGPSEEERAAAQESLRRIRPLDLRSDRQEGTP
jgi:hypothetical protein